MAECDILKYDSLANSLRGTRKTLVEVCKELGIDFESIDHHNLLVGQCCSCRVWHRSIQLINDLDDNPICHYCEDLMGL